MGRRVRRIVIALTVISSALFAHVAIDLAGDFMLARDAYDDVAHHSRESVFVIACLLAAVAGWRTLCAVRGELRGSRGSLRALLYDSVPASLERFVAAVAAAAVPTLLAMAGLDSAIDMRAIGDVDDLFGGSVLLGLVCTLGSAVTFAALTWSAIRALARLDRVVLRLVAILAERARQSRLCAGTLVRIRPTAFSAATICARSVGLRAPPQAA
jgi:hypothetical protein